MPTDPLNITFARPFEPGDQEVLDLLRRCPSCRAIPAPLEGGGELLAHLPDCSVISGWAWPIPPEHAGPCACRKMNGSEHFTEHTPIGCSLLPADLTERLLSSLDAMARTELGIEPDVVARARADEISEELEAISARARAVHPEVYAP